MDNTPFDYDVFISYRFGSNRGMGGWVTNLHADLDDTLSSLLGRPARIWRDDGESFFANPDEYLRNAVNKASILIIVMFHDFIESEWCLKELRWFIKDNEPRGGAMIGNKSRVFVIRASYFPRDRIPPEVENLMGWDFFEYDGIRDKYTTLKRGVNRELDKKYWEKVLDLAKGIRDMLELLGQQEPKFWSQQVAWPRPANEPTPCPYCGEPLRTSLAKQCRFCRRDWHDPDNVIFLGAA